VVGAFSKENISNRLYKQVSPVSIIIAKAKNKTKDVAREYSREFE